MNSANDRKFVGRLIFEVLTERKKVREAIKLFPETKDLSIECAYHALVHFEADDSVIGKFINVKIIRAEPFNLHGEIVKN